MYVVHKIPLPRLYNPIFGGGVLLFWSSYKQSFSPSLLDAGCILFLLVFCPKKKTLAQLLFCSCQPIVAIHIHISSSFAISPDFGIRFHSYFHHFTQLPGTHHDSTMTGL